MRIIYSLLVLFILCSYTISDSRKLENGTYKAELDTKYKEMGLHNFEFTLEEEVFILNFNNQIANLKIEWQNDSEFIVKGFTQPLKPTEEERAILRNKYAYFKLLKRQANTISFCLKHNNDDAPIYSGKFIKQ